MLSTWTWARYSNLHTVMGFILFSLRDKEFARHINHGRLEAQNRGTTEQCHQHCCTFHGCTNFYFPQFRCMFVELSDNSSSVNPQQTVKICNSAVTQHSIVPSSAVCALNRALFGLSRRVRFTFEYIQCCQSGWPKTAALKKQFPHSLYRNRKSLGRIRQKSNFLHLIQRLLKQPSSKHFDRCLYVLHPFGFLKKSLFLFDTSCRPGEAGVIVHGKRIIAAGTEMAQRWADHAPSHILPVAATRPLTQAHGLIRSQRRGQWLLPDLKEVFGGCSVRGSKVRQKCPLSTFLLCNLKGEGQHSSSFKIHPKPLPAQWHIWRIWTACAFNCTKTWTLYHSKDKEYVRNYNYI